MKDYEITEITTKKELDELYEHSTFTWEGMSTDPKNLEAIVEAISDKINGTIHLITFTGKLMNDMYELTGSNRYPEELIFLSIKDFYDVAFKMSCGARWFDDIVDNNRMRENRYKEGEEN